MINKNLQIGFFQGKKISLSFKVCYSLKLYECYKDWKLKHLKEIKSFTRKGSKSFLYFYWFISKKKKKKKKKKKD